MKAKKLMLLTASLITAAALLLTGSLALLAGASDEETPLPADSGVPDLSDSETPVSVDSLTDCVTVTETDGKKTARIFSEEQLASFAQRREDGEWLSLSMDEMLAIVNDTVALFYDSHVIELGIWEDGAYSVRSYNGYLHYTSDEYTKKTGKDAPDAERDVFEIILQRVKTLHDGMSLRNDGSMVSSMSTESYYVFADVPRMDENELEFLRYGSGHRHDENWQTVTYSFLRFYVCDSRIELVEHNYENVEEGDYPDHTNCHPAVQVFCSDAFAKDFVKTEEVEGSRRVRVEIYDEATQTLVDTFTITDAPVVDSIFDGFFVSFDNACKRYEEFLASDEDKAYRGQYRIIAHLESTFENVTETGTRDIDICYPYGYSNDIYGYLHDDLWMDYQIKGGSEFIELIDEYVDAYIPAE